MPANITEVDAFTAPVTVPLDSETIDAADVTSPFQAVADRTKYLQNRVLDAGAGGTEIVLPLLALQNTAVARFELEIGTSGGVPSLPLGWTQQSISDFGTLLFPIPPLKNAKISNVKVVLDGDGGGGGAHSGLPATMPIVDILIWTNSTDTLSSVAITGGTDTSGSAGAYDTKHEIGGAPVSTVTANSDRQVWIRFRGESGTNSSAGSLSLKMVRITLEAQ